jgi:hypothetical protein
VDKKVENNSEAVDCPTARPLMKLETGKALPLKPVPASPKCVPQAASPFKPSGKQRVA